MLNGTYYYGEAYNPAQLSGMLYPDALKQKIKWAKALIIKIDTMPLFIESDGVRYAIRDITRRNRSAKSIRDNQQLLDELNGY